VTPKDADIQSTFTESFIKESLQNRVESLRNLNSINRLMQQHSSNAGVIFTALPPTPDPSRPVDAASYINDLDTLSG